HARAERRTSMPASSATPGQTCRVVRQTADTSGSRNEEARQKNAPLFVCDRFAQVQVIEDCSGTFDTRRFVPGRLPTFLNPQSRTFKCDHTFLLCLKQKNRGDSQMKKLSICLLAGAAIAMVATSADANTRHRTSMAYAQASGNGCWVSTDSTRGF